jgi:hypothetical protein
MTLAGFPFLVYRSKYDYTERNHFIVFAMRALPIAVAVLVGLLVDASRGSHTRDISVLRHVPFAGFFYDNKNRSSGVIDFIKRVLRVVIDGACELCGALSRQTQ